MTLSELMDIATKWIAVFDLNEECEEHLISRGFNAFKIGQELLADFANDPSDVSLHKACHRELCKWRVSTDGALSFRPELDGRYYRPPTRNTLLLSRARSFGFQDIKPFADAFKSKNESWQTEPDPLLRAKTARILSAGQDFLHDWIADLQDATRSQREVEATLLFPDSYPPLLPRDRLEVVRTNAAPDLAKLGFKHASTRIRDYLAFDRLVRGDLILRWSIGEYGRPLSEEHPIRLKPILHLRSNKFKKRLDGADRNTLSLNFAIESIIEEFRMSYMIAENTKELLLNVNAHITLLEWALPHVLNTLD